MPIMNKHKESKFLLPCSNILKKRLNKSMEESDLDYTKAEMYKVVCSDLSHLKNVSYDVLVFFSPTGIKSLYENFPKFEQNNTRIAVFGPSTLKSVEKHNLIADIIKKYDNKKINFSFEENQEINIRLNAIKRCLINLIDNWL